MQTLRLLSVKRDHRLVCMCLRCEHDCSHAYVEPNMVNTAILTRCIVVRHTAEPAPSTKANSSDHPEMYDTLH